MFGTARWDFPRAAREVEKQMKHSLLLTLFKLLSEHSQTVESWIHPRRLSFHTQTRSIQISSDF
ncbi:MAG: hypothetical protein COT73_04780 [Bdellovibrio sp. CG10_big_fil_rev_8_21_14_0_10_47_8]|nr:MAG: hypothetical protein COT73_04780 [Bdellovibrio sp. CG10_big_fil_rev_8_21_14_0_10_47_8]